jgi:hypothetical protein
MANVYNYSKSVDFPSGLFPSVFQASINANGLIVPNCEFINVIDDDVQICFNAALSGAEQTELNNMVTNYVVTPPTDIFEADKFKVADLMPLFCKYELTGLNLTAGVKTYPTNFTKVSGDLAGFDAVTGEFTTTQNCIYLYNININSASANNNTDLKIRLEDDLGNVLFGQDSRLNQVGNCYAFMGTGGILTPADTIKYSLQVDTNNFTCNLEVRYLMLFCN